MTAKGRSSATRPGVDIIFLNKAREFADQMDSAMADRKWNAGALLGVHAAIAASDALTSRTLDLHSMGQSHDEAAELLRTVRIDGASEKVRQLRNIIAAKHAAAYEYRAIREDEAIRLAKQVHRFLEWVEHVLGEMRPTK